MRLLLLFTLLWLTAIEYVHGQRYPFYEVKGVVQSQIQDIKQDNFGNLWIGTVGGLSRYNGESVKNYTVRQGLLENQIYTLEISSNNNIWLGHQRGVTFYDGQNFKGINIDTKGPLPNAIGTQISIQNDTSAWVLIHNQLFLVSPNSIKELELPLQNAMYCGIFFIPKVGLHLVTVNNPKIYVKNSTSNQWRLNQELKGAHYAYKIIKNQHQDKIYLLGDQGVYHWSNKRFEPFNNKSIIEVLNQKGLFHAFTQLDESTFWVSFFTGGTAQITKEETIYFNANNGLFNNLISTIYQDKEKNLWLGTDGRGLHRYPGSSIRILDQNAGLPNPQVSGLISIDKNHLLICTYDGQLLEWKNGVSTLLKIHTNTYSSIASFLKLNDEEVLIGYYSGELLIYNTKKKSFNNYNIPTKLVGISTLKKHGDRIFVGANRAAYIIQNNHAQPIYGINEPVTDFLSINNDSVAIFGVNNNWIWTNGVIYKWHTNTIIDSQKIQCASIKGNQIWLGTAENGLIHWNKNTNSVTLFNSDNYLKNDFIYSVLVDRFNNTWVGTGMGVYQIKQTDKGYKVIHFNELKGVPEAECNHHALIETQDSAIWIGTTMGAFRFEEKPSYHEAVIQSLVITSVTLNGETIKDKSYYSNITPFYDVPLDLKLPSDAFNLGFKFLAISLNDQDQINYRYKIIGLTDNWSEWSTNNTLYFPSISPGNYSLIIEAKNNNSSATTTYHFEITPKFYQTIWFKVILGLATLGLLLLWQYSISLKKRKRERQLRQIRLREQAIIRQRTAEDFHDEVGNKITRINILSSVLRKKIEQINPEQTKLIEQIQDNTLQLYNGTRDILWSLDPKHDNLLELSQRFQFIGEEFFKESGINFSVKGITPSLATIKIGMDQGRNLTMIFKEAMNNIVKYAAATEVTVTVKQQTDHDFELIIQDNGKGFDLKNYKAGNGIFNMKQRAERINAIISIQSSNQQGTTIIINNSIKNH